MSFNEFCIKHTVTKRERDGLAWQLAMLRARELYVVLR